MNPPASGSGGQEAGKPEGGTFGVDAPMVPVAWAAAALLLVIIGCVLMITNGLVAGLVAVIFAFVLRTVCVQLLCTRRCTESSSGGPTCSTMRG